MKVLRALICAWLTLFDASALQPKNSSLSVPLWTLVVGGKDLGAFPHRFRTSRDKVHHSVNHKGLDTLNISGSAQFSVEQLENILMHIENFGFVKAQVVVIDLREEPHAFINGQDFMWYARSAWWLQAEPVSLIMAQEKKRLKSLPLGQKVILKQITHKDALGNIQGLVDKTYLIHALKTEEEAVKEAGAHYIRLPVTDHMVPQDKTVDQFLILIKSLYSVVWFHFHCHGGHGRTSTFMIMYDIIRNPHLPLSHILDRQVQLGSMDVRHVSHKVNSKKFAQIARFDFIKLFYDYVHAVDGYGVRSWTSWKAQRYIQENN